jgi:GntR family transcriptional repressor for pyruvate dehydrogenase complex
MYNDHVPIFEAIAAGDADAARKAMAKHMAGARGRLAPEFFDRMPVRSAQSPQGDGGS